MNQEAFNKTVRAMKAEGIALSMPNLMVRTELPRATIEEWLEELDHPVAKPGGRAGEGKSARRPSVDPADDVAGALFDRMADLKNDLARTAATAMVKDKLGIDDDVERVSPSPLSERKMKDLRWGAGLGLLGPLGLFYSAPYPVAALATAGYIALWALSFLPIVGTLVGYLLPIAHLAAALAGAAYTWRYNRTGKRSALVPDGGRARRRRRAD